MAARPGRIVPRGCLCPNLGVPRLPCPRLRAQTHQTTSRESRGTAPSPVHPASVCSFTGTCGRQPQAIISPQKALVWPSITFNSNKTGSSY